MRERPTPAETRMIDLLTEHGIRFRFKSIKFSNGISRIFDFYVPGTRTAIYVMCMGPGIDPADIDESFLRVHPGWSIYRFTDDEVLTCSDRVVDLLRSLSS